MFIGKKILPTVVINWCFLTPEEEFKEQIRPILDQVYVYAEKIVGIESIETMLSELKSVCDVLENV